MGSQLGRLGSCCRNQVSEGTRVVRPGFWFEDEDRGPNPNHAYAQNVVKTTKYTLLSFLPLNLFEQFHRFANIYFLFIVVLNFMPEVSAFAREVAPLPILLVLTMKAVKDGFEDYQRYKADKRVNSKLCRVYRRRAGDFVSDECQSLWPGDIVQLGADELIPADILLLHSSDPAAICYVETANIDGETNLKQCSAVALAKRRGRSSRRQGDAKFDPDLYANCSVEVELPNPSIYQFQGKIQCDQKETPLFRENLLLRGCAIRNTRTVCGMVVYAGNETKASLNNQGPRFKQSKLESQINYDIIWCIIILFIMCFLGSVGSGFWLSSFSDLPKVPFLAFTEDSATASPAMQAFINFWTYIIILQSVIPIALYVTVEFAKYSQIMYINNDMELYDEESDTPAECKAWNITEDLGQIQYVFCDKTGTLTENKMLFKRCSIGGHDFLSTTDKDTSCGDTESNIPSARDKQQQQQQQQQQAEGPTTLDGTPLGSLRQRIAEFTFAEAPQDPDDPAEVDGRTLFDFFLVMSLCNSVLVSAADEKSKEAAAAAAEVLDDDTDETGRPASRKKSKRRRRRRLQELHQLQQQQQHDCPMSDAQLFDAYVAESPDEAALVKTACSFGFKLLQRSPHFCHLWLPAQGHVKVEVLHVLPFDSERKRMSVVVRHPRTGHVLLLTKGADSVIFNLLRKSHAADLHSREAQLVAKTKVQLHSYAVQGLRTLCLAARRVGEEEYADWLGEWQRAQLNMSDRAAGEKRLAELLERQLELLGVAAIEDRLQDGVPDTLSSLRAAGMHVWVLTGDKQETAVQVAKTAKLLRPWQQLLYLNASSQAKCAEMVRRFLLRIQGSSAPRQQMQQRQQRPSVHKEFALIVDGETLRLCVDADGEGSVNSELADNFRRLAEQCGSVVCCRTTPRQKSAIVGMMQRLGMRTLAIGDGANDVNMIQTADVGVGIAGQEGMQATMAADFCLGRFRFLRRLMLVHGHWCYDRLARMSLYLLYKNIMYAMLLFWFQVFNGFSGQVHMGQLYQICFNLSMTSLAPLLMGILDRHLRAEVLMANPLLYQDPRECRSYLPWHFWYNLADAVWQSLVAFFVPYLAVAGSDCDMLQFGDYVVGTACMCAVAHNAIEMRSWTGLHWYALVGSPIVAWVMMALIMNIICVDCLHPDNPYYLMLHSMSAPEFWLSLLMAPVLGLLPRVCYRAFVNSTSDNLTVQAMRLQNLPQYQERPRLPLKEPPPWLQASSEQQRQQALRMQSTPMLRSNNAAAAANGEGEAEGEEFKAKRHRRSRSVGMSPEESDLPNLSASANPQAPPDVPLRKL